MDSPQGEGSCKGFLSPWALETGMARGAKQKSKLKKACTDLHRTWDKEGQVSSRG